MIRIRCFRGSFISSCIPRRSIHFSFSRPYSTPPHGPQPSSHKTHARFARVSSRLPKFLQRYTTPLINAPFTHIVSFLVLHEITAVVPLFALFATFHYTSWTPGYFSQGKWFGDGMQKFGNYFRKKGWLGEEGISRRLKWWDRGEGGLKIVTE